MSKEKFNSIFVFIICFSCFLQSMDGVKDSKKLDCLVALEHPVLKISPYSFGCKIGAALD